MKLKDLQQKTIVKNSNIKIVKMPARLTIFNSQKRLIGRQMKKDFLLKKNTLFLKVLKIFVKITNCQVMHLLKNML